MSERMRSKLSYESLKSDFNEGFVFNVVFQHLMSIEDCWKVLHKYEDRVTLISKCIDIVLKHMNYRSFTCEEPAFGHEFGLHLYEAFSGYSQDIQTIIQKYILPQVVIVLNVALSKPINKIQNFIQMQVQLCDLPDELRTLLLSRSRETVLIPNVDQEDFVLELSSLLSKSDCNERQLDLINKFLQEIFALSFVSSDETR